MPESPITNSLAYLRAADHDAPEYTEGRVEAIVRAWHNDTHRGTFRFCDEHPCHAINRPAG